MGLEHGFLHTHPSCEGASEPSCPQIKLATMNHLLVFRKVASTGFSWGPYEVNNAKSLRSLPLNGIQICEAWANAWELMDSIFLLASPLLEDGQGAGKKVWSLIWGNSVQLGNLGRKWWFCKKRKKGSGSRSGNWGRCSRNCRFDCWTY